MKNQIFIEKNITSRKFNVLKNQNEENELFESKKPLVPRNSKMKDSQTKFIILKGCKVKNSDNFILMKEDGQKKSMINFLKE